MQVSKREKSSYINIIILKLFVVWLYTEEQEITKINGRYFSFKKTPKQPNTRKPLRIR